MIARERGEEHSLLKRELLKEVSRLHRKKLCEKKKQFYFIIYYIQNYKKRFWFVRNIFVMSFSLSYFLWLQVFIKQFTQVIVYTRFSFIYSCGQNNGRLVNKTWNKNSAQAKTRYFYPLIATEMFCFFSNNRGNLWSRIVLKMSLFK